MKCGLCKSGITADEKFKTLKDGTTNRHVYYRCCKSKDSHCKNKTINETDLVEQLRSLVEDLDIVALPMREKITHEVQRIKKFYALMFNEKTQIHVKNIDIRNYAKFILQEGSIGEKREFLDCLKNDILLENKKLSLR